ncbi:Eco57I restriction-modification methylase domain-containing protein [Fusibacter sp. JL298sf-3]
MEKNETSVYIHEKVFYENTQCPDGTVYTPDHIAQQLVDLALLRYATQHETEVGTDAFVKRLLSAQIIDVACGTGQLILALLRTVKQWLTATQLKTFISGQIFAVDIDPRALAVLEDAVRTLYDVDVSPHLAMRDVLLAELPFETQVFDIVLGNPPYIGEKGHKSLFDEVRQTAIGAAYYEARMDYFYFFVYRGRHLLKADGVLCYVTTNYFLTADGARKLRRFLKETLFVCDYLDLSAVDAFNGRKLHACVYTLVKEKPKAVAYRLKPQEISREIPYEALFDEIDNIRFNCKSDIVEKMMAHRVYRLGEVYHIAQGIVSGADRVKGAPCFVYTNEERQRLSGALNALVKPFYKNSQIKHYYHEPTSNYFLLYAVKGTCTEAIECVLSPFRAQLEKRREVQKGVRKWHELTWPRKASLFTGEKIVVPQRATDNRFAYSNAPFYASADVYFIKSTPQSPYSLLVLTALLNSAYYYTWLYEMGKRKGQLLELYATPLKNIPLPAISPATAELLERSVQAILAHRTAAETEKYHAVINRLVKKIFEK